MCDRIGDLEDVVVGARARRQAEQSGNDSSSLYYMSLRSTDSAGNTAGWSNKISASYLDPATFRSPVSQHGGQSCSGDYYYLKQFGEDQHKLYHSFSICSQI